MEKDGMKRVPVLQKGWERQWLMMKLFCLLLTVLVLPASGSVYSQQQKIDIALENVTVEALIREIKSKTALDFLYNIQEIEQSGRISVNLKKATVETVLREAFKGKPLSFSVVNDVVVIRPGQVNAMPQTREMIRGIVKDTEGMPLPGVSVMIKGTTVGVITNSKGEYEIVKPDGTPIVLIFSFIGMKKMAVQYKGQKSLDVEMEEDSYALEAVNVVETGYGTIDKRHLTSSISSVKAEDILVPGMTSISQALEGRIPDLLLMSNSGEVGATPRIRVRGTSTLLGNREPLWVLDGIILKDPVDVEPDVLNDPDYINVIGNAIAGVNPQDIERIDVLKDASATAIYGTAAANGVIVVTTKRGAIGKARISYSHSSKITRRPRYSDRNIYLMNSQERIQFGKDLVNAHFTFPGSMPLVGYEGTWNRLQNGEINYAQFLSEVQYYEHVNTDWFDILTRDAYSHDHTLSISGGSEDMRYYASIGYNREDGVSRTTYGNRYSMMLNLDATISPKFRASLRLNGNVQKKNNLISAINAMDYAYNTSRAVPCYNADGSLYYYKESEAYSFSTNPPQLNMAWRYNILNEIENTSSKYDGNGIMATLDLNLTPFEGWRLSAIGSYSRNSTLQEEWWGEKTNYIARMKNGEAEDVPLQNESGKCLIPYGGLQNTNNTISESMTFRLQSDFSRYFGEDQRHFGAVTFGYEVNTSKSKAINDEIRGYLKERGLQFVDYTKEELDKYPYFKEWTGKSHRKLTNNLTNKLSGYLTLTYSYREMITLNVNGRFDASNKFGSRSNERFLPIWSVSGMWNIRQTWMKDKEQMWLSDARLRLSYGQQGNMIDGQTPNMLLRKGTMSTFYNENVSTLHMLPNPNLKWEVTNQINVALDLSFFESRLNVMGEFYYKKTTDLFADINVSTVNGVGTYKMNNGDMENRGFSVSLSGNPIRTKNVKWHASTFYSVNRNKVKTEPVENYTINHYLDGTAIIPGKSVSTFYSYKFKGLNPRNGVPMFDDYADRQHLLRNKSLQQIVMMVMEESGTRDPVFQGNLSNSISYKNLNLSFNLAYSLGSKVRLFDLFAPVKGGVSAKNNIRKEFVNRWQIPGDELRTDIPALMSIGDPEYGNYAQHFSYTQGWADANSSKSFAANVWDMYDKSDVRVVSGNYLKMQSLSLRYTLAEKLIKKTPFSMVSFSFSTTNLFTISAKALKGQDPSQAGFAKPNLSVRPAYTLGLNVSF